MSTSLELPKRLALRPRDRRGFPIPWIQFVHPETGEPDFRVNDVEKVRAALTRRLCGLCGQPLGAHVFFIGGPKCAANGYFLDPPMHRDCAEFALRTCPHLARAKGKYNEGAKPEVEGYAVVVSDLMSDTKAETFALMHGKRYDFGHPSPKEPLLIKAELPWLDVTWWRDGEVVPGPEA